MAKTIMIADRVYAELKKEKGNDKSFSEVIAEALEASRPKKTIGNLLKHVGALKGYKEDKEAAKWLRNMWKMWDKHLNEEMNRKSF